MKLPQVHINDILGESGETKAKSFFSKENGFVPHKPDQDYGEDLLCKIIIDGKVLGKFFPVQVKSTSDLSKSLKQEYYSVGGYPVHNLNFLLSFTPYYGLIVLYDDSTKECYFDFVEKVAARLDFRNKCWRDQNKTTISIPKKNQLDKERLAQIHQFFVNRIERHSNLLLNHGRHYHIPIFQENLKFDINEIHQSNPSEVLEKYGLVLIDFGRIDILLDCIQELTLNELLKSSRLMLVAALTYTWSDNPLMAQTFLSRATSNLSAYNEEEKTLLQFAQIRNGVLTGSLDHSSLTKYLEGLEGQEMSSYNSLAVRLNSIHNKILTSQLDFDELTNFISQSLQLFDEIQMAKLRRNLECKLELINGSNLALLWSYSRAGFALFLNGQDTRTRANKEVTTYSKEIHDLGILIDAKFRDIAKYAQDENDELLESLVLYERGNKFYLTLMDGLITNNLPSFSGKLYGLIAHYCEGILKAFNTFIKNHHWRFAQLSLTCCDNIFQICHMAYNYRYFDNQRIDQIRTKRNQIETEYGLRPYRFTIELVLDARKKAISKDATHDLVNMKSRDFQLVVNTVSEVQHLTEKAQSNLVKEMNSFKEFYSSFSHEEFELISFRASNYTTPSTYLVISKKTGLRTDVFEDISKIVMDFKKSTI